MMLIEGKTESVVLTAILIMVMACCSRPGQPRPRGYFRIDLPEKQYRLFDSATCPFIFEYPVYGNLKHDYNKGEEPCWFNIEFPEYKAKIHLSYKNIMTNLPALMEDSYTLTYNHTIKADAICETPFVNDEENVYGLLYDLKGNTATAVQFYMTDSAIHFMRGSLYFYASPNEDSLAPLIKFFRDDIVHLIETLRWK